MSFNVLPTRARLYTARFKATTVAGEATAFVPIASGDERILYGGEGYWENAHADDYCLVDIVLNDETTVVKTMYDVTQASDMQGWYFRDGKIRFEPIGDTMVVPGDTKIRIRAFKGDGSQDTLRGNIIWGLK